MAAHPPAVHDGARRTETRPGSAGSAGTAPGPAPCPGLGPAGTDRGSVPAGAGVRGWGVPHLSPARGSGPASPEPSWPQARRSQCGARRGSRELGPPEPAA